MDKATLLAKLRTNRALFERLLAHVSPQYLMQPYGDDERSVKDILAHLTAWEQRIIQRLDTAHQGDAAPLQTMTRADMDQFNAHVLAANRDRSWQEVVTAFHHSFQQLLDRVQAFTDAELTEPQHFAWLEGSPLWRYLLSGPAYFHYQAHMYDLAQRIAPGDRYHLSPHHQLRYCGTYQHAEFGSLTFQVREDGQYMTIRSAATDEEVACLAIDETHVAHRHGLVTFELTADGSVPRLECWSHVFTRVS
ncbi:MAG: ClbS/DfsB family four-helix bundle protein [Chloroflexota bacterium]|nr:ClbS/DfsB family four-helix bundle protein [Chloroflexota bacterium]